MDFIIFYLCMVALSTFFIVDYFRNKFDVDVESFVFALSISMIGGWLITIPVFGTIYVVRFVRKTFWPDCDDILWRQK